MIESHVTGPATCPTIAAQRNFQLARQHSGANKGSRQKPPFLLDTRLSSSPFSLNSTRHSVTSRIASNSRLLCYLIFSTRHLNATLEKRNLVEKFNTFFKQSFTHVSGLDLTNVVRKEGVEPPRPHGHRILSPARLPIPPLPHRNPNNSTLKPYVGADAARAEKRAKKLDSWKRFSGGIAV